MNKEQMFELYNQIKKVTRAYLFAGMENTKERNQTAMKEYRKMLELLRKNCKEEFVEWPDDEENK